MSRKAADVAPKASRSLIAPARVFTVICVPRKPRILETGAIYHVTARGNRRQELFRSPPDQGLYLSARGRAAALSRVRRRRRHRLASTVAWGHVRDLTPVVSGRATPRAG